MVADSLRRQQSRRDSAPAWTLSFADLMMLLLTFFILLLSMSDLDKEKYREVANSFDDNRGHSALLLEPASLAQPIEPKVDLFEKKAGVIDFSMALEDELKNDLVQIEEMDGSVVIRFQERIAFNSASESLDDSFLPVLQKISTILEEVQGAIAVSGHTDDMPIANYRFRSNWDLSSARAVSVIHALMQNTQIPAEKFSAVGYADTRPFVPNDTPEHRALNRRVEIRVDLHETENGAISSEPGMR